MRDNSTGLLLLQQSLGEERIKLQQPLDEVVVHKTGAVAEGLTVVTSTYELTRVLDLVHDLRLPYQIIGSGTKVFSQTAVKGLVIKNRVANARIIAFKGKFGKGEIGIEEATIEIDSGMSLAKLSEYLAGQGLAEVEYESEGVASIGGAVFSDSLLRTQIEKLKVWQNGEVSEVEIFELRKLTDVVVSVIVKLKARLKE